MAAFLTAFCYYSNNRNTDGMKTFTIDSNIFIQTFKSRYDLIEWTFTWNGVIYMNKEFKELIIDNYSNN